MPSGYKPTETVMSNTIIAGVGGQGTVLASKLLANAALLEGHMVRAAETIGMAQRGGSVLGHVRITRISAYGGARSGTFKDEPMSPLIPAGFADLLIGFEPGETVRALPYLRKGGVVVTARQAITPVAATSAVSDRKLINNYNGIIELNYLRSCCKTGRIEKLIIVDGTTVCAALGSSKVLNVLLIGASLTTKSIEVTKDSLLSALDSLVRAEFLELNKRALLIGMGSLDLHGNTTR